MSDLKETCEFTFPAAWLKGALLCAAEHDVRYYLKSVYFDFPAGNFVATDGARMFVGRLPDDAPRDVRPVIVNREVIDRALKGVTRKVMERLYFTVTVSSDGGYKALREVSITGAGAVFSAPEVDARFPEYVRVIPREFSGAPCYFNVDYQRDAVQALSWYATRGPAKYAGCPIAFNGKDNAAVLYRHDGGAIVVLMPMRMADGFTATTGETFPDFTVPAPLPEVESEAAAA